MWTTASAPSNSSAYVVGWRILPFLQFTDSDHDGATADAETEDHVGSPDRDMEVTAHPRPTAALQIRLPEGNHVSTNPDSRIGIALLWDCSNSHKPGIITGMNTRENNSSRVAGISHLGSHCHPQRLVSACQLHSSHSEPSPSSFLCNVVVLMTFGLDGLHHHFPSKKDRL